MLIEKRGKDRCLIEYWRPISFLNVDVKIMSKVIAARIKYVLPIIIHQIFSLARDWSKRITWANIPQLKLGNI